MYTVKSGYWVAKNILNKEMVKTQEEPSITKL
ncbi:BnaC01g30450D [Brassica napus]|uniref:BnaC01g30450D protein n=1 Tax=Brassica napus TaxID=3708 RepID=A0A078I5Z5_BRANA|nr:BnaC01g30450D [Brassica napus]